MKVLLHLSILFLALCSVLLVGCLSAFRVAECPANPAQDLLEEINEARVTAGVLPVRPNLLLAVAAQGHARALSRGRAIGHRGNDGSDPLMRITDAGYQPVAFGENVAAGTRSPVLIIQAWLRSPAHRDVLLDPAVREVGLGGMPESDPPVWVADFGASREDAEARCHPWPVS